MEFKAREIADILGGTVDGNPDATVSTFARIEQGKPGANRVDACPDVR